MVWDAGGTVQRVMLHYTLTGGEPREAAKPVCYSLWGAAALNAALAAIALTARSRVRILAGSWAIVTSVRRATADGNEMTGGREP